MLSRLGTWPALGVLLALLGLLPVAYRDWAWPAALLTLLLLLLAARRAPSRVELGLMGFYGIGTLAALLAPDWLHTVIVPHAAALANLCLLMATGLPRLLGAEPFTLAYARRKAPPEAWQSDVFLAINLWLSRFWLALFLLATIGGILLGNHPLVLLLPIVIGMLLNRLFPRWYLARVRNAR